VRFNRRDRHETNGMAQPFAIRDFLPEDYGRMAEIIGSIDSEYRPTGEELRYEDDIFDRSKHVMKRYIVVEIGADRPIAFAEYAHAPLTYHPKRFRMDIEVDPPSQGKGVGSLLWKRIESDLRGLTAVSVTAGTADDRPAAVSFLLERGFKEKMRTWENVLDLLGAGSSGPSDALQRALPQGITISTLEEECGRDETCLDKLYALYVSIMPDIPLAGGAFTGTTMGEFMHDYVERSGTLLDAFFIAKDGDSYVGLCSLCGEKGTANLWQTFTGVQKEHRRKGIGTALKLSAIHYAKSHGASTIKAVNVSTNAGMLSLNEKLGYQRKGGFIFYQKDLG
jgi:GNAT superfamily N-acetyltransferase